MPLHKCSGKVSESIRDLFILIITIIDLTNCSIVLKLEHILCGKCYVTTTNKMRDFCRAILRSKFPFRTIINFALFSHHNIMRFASCTINDSRVLCKVPHGRRVLLISTRAIVINRIFVSKCECHEGADKDEERKLRRTSRDIDHATIIRNIIYKKNI